MSGKLRVAVVGGGAAGLAAADLLADECAVTVLEQSSQLGGKLRSTELAGIRIDEGAESFLVRRPEAAELCADLGLTLVHPQTTAASVLVGERLRPMPRGTLLGVPGHLAALARSGVLAPHQLARVLLDRLMPGGPLTADVSVGDLVTKRLGRPVVDRLVDPLLGGVYAGRADEISLAMAVPPLYAAMRSERSLLAAASRLLPPAQAVPGPVFASVEGGADQLTTALGARIRGKGATINLSEAVTSLVASEDEWVVGVGGRQERFDAVVLACPGIPASRLLRDVAPAAAKLLATVDYASVAIVNLVYAPDDLRPAKGSGYLVAESSHRIVKAVTFVGQKWQRGSGEGPVVIRASVGRHGDTASLALADAELVARVHAEVAPFAGASRSPVASHVTRWGGALPQYRPGHLDLVASVRSGLPARLVVVGAAYDGVGIPACIGSGQSGAEALLRQLSHEREGHQAQGA